jgi:protein FAM32A
VRGVLRLRPPIPFPSHPTPHPTLHAPLLPPPSDHADGRKKKKKKSHAPEDRARKEADVTIAAESSKHRERDERSERTRDREERDERRGSASASASPAPASGSGRRMTDAERRFEEVQRKRREERAKKNAHLTHKERVAQLNARLDSMSEHYDMPRVSGREERREDSLEAAVMSACGADDRSDQAKSSGMPQGVPLSSSVSPRRACMLSEDLVSIRGVDVRVLTFAG